MELPCFLGPDERVNGRAATTTKTNTRRKSGGQPDTGLKRATVR
jgi:hypothetical protein